MEIVCITLASMFLYEMYRNMKAKVYRLFDDVQNSLTHYNDIVGYLLLVCLVSSFHSNTFFFNLRIKYITRTLHNSDTLLKLL